ncbi:MAG: hypothetical protein RJA20_1674 [Bacteroidota bacterium]
MQEKTSCFIFVLKFKTKAIQQLRFDIGNVFHENIISMDLQVFESKKGTKVVTASGLHTALKLPARQYSTQVRRWIRDIYEFTDGMRKPQPYRDYAKRPRPGEPIEDFFITLELAKLIALRTNSKQKLKYARLLDMIAGNGQLKLFGQAAA